jgi:hypothetical protein
MQFKFIRLLEMRARPIGSTSFVAFAIQLGHEHCQKVSLFSQLPEPPKIIPLSSLAWIALSLAGRTQALKQQSIAKD